VLVLERGALLLQMLDRFLMKARAVCAATFTDMLLKERSLSRRVVRTGSTAIEIEASSAEIERKGVELCA